MGSLLFNLVSFLVLEIEIAPPPAICP